MVATVKKPKPLSVESIRKSLLLIEGRIPDRKQADLRYTVSLLKKLLPIVKAAQKVTKANDSEHIDLYDSIERLAVQLDKAAY